MNILYIDHYAGSLRDGMEFRPYYFAREWQKMGHKVRVLGGDYSHVRTHQPEVPHDLCTEIIDGVEYQWIKAGTYEGNGTKRAISIFRFCRKLYSYAGKIAADFKPDVVITSSTYPLDCYAGRRIAKKAGGRYFHESHDLWPLTLIELGGMSKYHPFVMLLAKAEKFAYQKSEKVISLLPNALEHMMGVGLQSPDKFVHIPNGIAIEDWESAIPMPDEHKECFDKLHKEGKKIICYVGGITKFDKIDFILEAADRERDNDKLAFVIVGKGVEKENFMAQAQKMNLTNLTFLPPVPKKAVPSVLVEADILYIALEYNSLYRYGISINKIYDYMMSGKPILFGGEAANLEVRDADCGIIFNSNDIDSLIKAIDDFMSMPEEELRRLGSNGHSWVLENCEYRILAERFIDALK
ncbi:MAG: glycosyltransferase family 4 protein [Saccharofermentans sp.]|nr:glycosyltransferase family 4 protein [Saccharofermentans sp.]